MTFPQRSLSLYSFSTLYGSKWVATLRCFTRNCNAFMFQYPLRVEVGCNVGSQGVPSDPAPVSVPSTGRSGLQPNALLDHAMLDQSFSTLYGSKWVATFSTHVHLVVRAAVSVPSTGRSGLQLPLFTLCLKPPHVSVPSTGRSGLQRHTPTTDG